MPVKIEVLDTGLVYRNRRPHLRSLHAYFPSLARAAGREIVCGLDIGSAFEAIDVKSYVCRSGDEGRSWSEPALVFQAPAETSTTCRIGATPQGQLVGLALLMDRRRADEGLANPATDGFVQTRWALVRSDDGGRSWSPPRHFAPPIDWNAFEGCSPIVCLPSGRWLAPTAIWPDWDGRNPLGSKAIVMVSDDRGENWRKSVDVMDQWRDRIGHYEQKQIVLSDGRLMAVCWVIDHNTKHNLPNRYGFSTDGGESYSPPRETSLLGETCTPIALAENRVMCVYRRMDQRGLWAHVAAIEGDRWKPLGEAALWGVNVAAHDTSQSSLLAQMSTLRFGCPSIIRLAGDEFLIAFWCVEDCVSNIRWIKVRTDT